MSEEQIILNQYQQPFSSFEQAAWLRDILISQSPGQYRVDLFDSNNDSSGFVVKEGYIESGEVLDVTEKQTVHSATINVINKVYHPALRTYLLHLPFVLLALCLVFFAVEIWLMILALLGVQGLPAVVNPTFLVNGTQLLGTIIVVWILWGILLNYYGTSLTVDQQGLTLKVGIISRDVINVRFAEIRTIGLRQGLFDRLLNIGILEFASSGTDDVDIRFINMPQPARVKAEIEQLIDQSR